MRSLYDDVILLAWLKIWHLDNGNSITSRSKFARAIQWTSQLFQQLKKLILARLDISVSSTFDNRESVKLRVHGSVFSHVRSFLYSREYSHRPRFIMDYQYSTSAPNIFGTNLASWSGEMHNTRLLRLFWQSFCELTSKSIIYILHI